MTQTIEVHGTTLPVIDYRGDRVVTLAMIDTAHGRAEGTAGRNFREHRGRLVKGEDYYELTADEIRRQSLAGVFPARTAKGLLLTETGYLMLAKSLTDDLAWQVQRALVQSYFRHASATIDGFGRGARQEMGGIFKAVATKAISDLAPQIVASILPGLVEAELSSHRFKLVEGVSATEVAELAGYGVGRRPRGFVQFVSRRLTHLHENRGLPVRRSRHGMGKVKLFDEPASRAWLRSGGQAEIDLYATERKGQGKLALVK